MIKPTRTASMALLSLCLVALPLASQEKDEPTAMAKKVMAAMESGIRSEDERARDANRKPLETLDFFGITPDMRVLELFPGGGWYTKLLAPALAEEGKLFTAFTTSSITPLIEKHSELGKVEHMDLEYEFATTPLRGVFTLTGFELKERRLDAVLTFRNYHNLDESSRDALNRQVFKALKKGGRYGIIDHTLRHNAPRHQEVYRRFDPVKTILEVQAAGFVLEASSDLHYRPDDNLQFDTQRATIRRNSDRFTLLFRKP